MTITREQLVALAREKRWTERRAIEETAREAVKVLEACYRETIDGKPSDTIALSVARQGLRTVAAVASLVNRAAADPRISRRAVSWAETIEDAFDHEAATESGIYSDRIHPAHLDQLARAAMGYKPAPPAPETDDADEAPAEDPAPVAADPETSTAPAEAPAPVAEAPAAPEAPACLLFLDVQGEAVYFKTETGARRCIKFCRYEADRPGAPVRIVYDGGHLTINSAADVFPVLQVLAGVVDAADAVNDISRTITALHTAEAAIISRRLGGTSQRSKINDGKKQLKATAAAVVTALHQLISICSNSTAAAEIGAAVAGAVEHAAAVAEICRAWETAPLAVKRIEKAAAWIRAAFLAPETSSTAAPDPEAPETSSTAPEAPAAPETSSTAPAAEAVADETKGAEAMKTAYFTPDAVIIDGQKIPASYTVTPDAVTVSTTLHGRPVAVRIPAEDPRYEAAAAAAACLAAAEEAAEETSTAAEETSSSTAAPAPEAPAADPAPAAEAPAAPVETVAAETITTTAAAPAAETISAAEETSSAAAPAPEKPAAPAREAAHKPIRDEAPAWLNTEITGRAWKIHFDGATERIRVTAAAEAPAAVRETIAAAGFFFRADLNCYVKRITWKAYRAAVALAAELEKLAA